MLLPACNGIFGDIYDEPAAEATPDNGFSGDDANGIGTLYIDATSYTAWTYINFHDRTVTPCAIGDAEPAEWDLAVHRYDAKTNGGAAAETGATSFNSFVNYTDIPEGSYVADIFTTNVVVTDMSHMMDVYLVYAESDYNPELSKWLNVDKSTMPPIYTPSNKVYVVRLADGTRAAVRLADFMDASGVKGFLTIEYRYPI